MLESNNTFSLDYYRSVELLRHMAALRGSQSDSEYAEAFQIIRWTVSAANMT